MEDKKKNVTRGKGGHFIMIRVTNHEGDMTIKIYLHLKTESKNT